ncbi:hypothetical protein OH77DRAFT_980824 [Trametes cingulata]|nr:hypothetical protein OH77DRAFT_980824 [Trametes cingulata]
MRVVFSQWRQHLRALCCPGFWSRQVSPSLAIAAASAGLSAYNLATRVCKQERALVQRHETVQITKYVCTAALEYSTEEPLRMVRSASFSTASHHVHHLRSAIPMHARQVHCNDLCCGSVRQVPVPHRGPAISIAHLNHGDTLNLTQHSVAQLEAGSKPPHLSMLEPLWGRVVFRRSNKGSSTASSSRDLRCERDRLKRQACDSTSEQSADSYPALQCGAVGDSTTSFLLLDRSPPCTARRLPTGVIRRRGSALNANRTSTCPFGQ